MFRSALAALLLIVGTVSLLACGGSSPPADQPEVPWPHGLEGFDAALVEALEVARAAVVEDPKAAATWMRLGMTYEAHVMLEYAGACYEEAVLIDGDDAKAWYRLAVMRGRDGDVEGTLAAYARVSELAPGYAPAYRRLGRFLIGVGRPERARAAFDAVLALEPGDVASVLGLAEVELELGEPERALSRLDAITRVPQASRGMFHRLRGTALSRLGRHDEAEPELALGRGARAGGADPWMREASEFKVGESAVLLRADRLIDGGQPSAALPLLRGLEERDPEDARIFTRKGRAYARLAEWPNAAAALGRASELDPDNIGLALASASAMINADDDAGALAAAERILAIDADHVEAQLLRAELLLGASRSSDASASVAAARERGIVSAALEVVGGKAEIEGGHPAAALLSFQRALAIDETNADAWAGAALAHLRLGDRVAGAAALERLSTLAPDHPLRSALEAALAEDDDR